VTAMAHELLTRSQMAPPRPAITCPSCTRYRSNFVGFASLHIPAIRQKLFDCTVHVSHGSRWVALPSRAQLDRDKQLIRDAGAR